MTSIVAHRDGRHRAAEDPALPDHLIAVPGMDWSFWRRLLLRSAGFPAANVLQLAPPGAAAAADRLLQAEARKAAALTAAQESVTRALDQLREAGRWEEVELRKPLLKVQRALSEGKVTQPVRQLAESTSDAKVRDAIEQFAEVCAAEQAEQASYEGDLERALDMQSAAIHRLVSDPRFQEAVIWQNRAGFATGIGKLLEHSPETADRNSGRRQKEELAANYLQRYCLKNDSIGFFGPLAWGEFRPEGDAITVEAGPALLSRRETFFESWCVDRVALTMLENPAVRPWLRPRRLPYVVLHGPMLFLPAQKPQPLPPLMLALLNACDGQRTAREIATELMENPALGVDSPAAIFSMLEECEGRKLIAWDFEGLLGPYAEARLWEQIEAIGDEEPRRECLATLEGFRRHRQRVAACGGDPAALNEALQSLEDAFTHLTDESATRRQGQNYGGRTLIYEECLRDVELTIGPQIRERLKEPLNLLQRSTRWYLGRTADHLREIFGEIYDRLTGGETAAVESGLFWREIEPFLFGDQQHRLRECMPEVQRRWEEILDLPEGQHQVEYRSEELRARVEAAFPTEGLDLPMARYCCPDLMIAAESYEALQRGDYQLVLGELHIGSNSLAGWVYLTLCPFRDQVFEWVDRDIPEPQVTPLPPKNNPIITTRTTKAHYSAKNYFIPPMDGSVVVPPERSISFADVVLERIDGQLVARSRDGRLRWDVFEFFADFVAIQLINGFSLIGKASHRPRISIDGLVIRRESWSFPVPDLPFAEEADTAARFIAARRWAREQGLPRFMFARTPNELKPFYVDFDSPITVDILARAARACAGHRQPIVSLSEMLPDPHQLWLEDQAGQRYTAELRIIMTMNPQGEKQS